MEGGVGGREAEREVSLIDLANHLPKYQDIIELQEFRNTILLHSL